MGREVLPQGPGAGAGSRERGPQERLDRFLELQQLLFRVAREIGPAVNLQQTLDVVLDAMRDLMQFKGGSICLLEGDAIRLVVSDPEVSEDVKRLRLPVGTGLSGYVVSTGESYYSADLLEDPLVDRSVHQTGSNITIRSWLGAPLVVLGQVTGLLQVDSAEPDAFDDDDRYVLEGLAAQVAGAIESARRYEMVVELERLKSDFIERVSHELRTPLTIMTGFATTLQEHGSDLSDDERRDFVARLTHASARLGYLVEEIVTISTVDSGIGRPVPTEVRVAEVVAAAVAATGRERDIEVDVPADLTCHTDPSVLERALMPLLHNALLYADGGRVRATRDGGLVSIMVEDAGPGIPAELRDRMFERFVRGKHTAAGMGLGLAIARHLVHTLRGRLSYEPLDPGSRFALEVGDLSSP